jgi:acylphosphatase
MKKNLSILVKGKVQGVYFRRDTQLTANKLGVKGTVANQEDGSVLIEAEADNATLDKFVSWCHDGPELANVTEVVVSEGSLKGFEDFQVLADPSDYLG